MMHWSSIPTKLQRELFDTAGSMGDVLQTGALRGQVARFLHRHKDEEIPAERAPKPQIDEHGGKDVFIPIVAVERAGLSTPNNKQ